MPQSLVTMRVHLIFSTKGRQRFITPEIEPELHAYLAAVLRAHDSPAILIGGTDDHVHVLFSLSKRRTLAEIVEKVKTESSKWVKRRRIELRDFYWQKGYAAFSIGKSGEPDLVRYIARQREHHKRTEFKDELRAFLSKYGVDYDEKYVWD